MGTTTDITKAGIMNALKTVAGLLENSFKAGGTPAADINKNLILTGAGFKSGLVPVEIAGRIINKKKDAGIPIGPLASGGQNLDLIMETIRVEEICKAIIKDLKVTVAIPPGTSVMATGGNAGGPIVVQGYTTEKQEGKGLER